MSSNSGDRLHDLVRKARHNSVTVAGLANKRRGKGRPRLHDRPPVSYLHADEQPHYLFESRERPICEGKSINIHRSRRYRVIHLVTDERWLILAGNRSGDCRHTIALEEITTIDYDTEQSRLPGRISGSQVYLETEEASYKIPLSRSISISDLIDLVDYLGRRVNAIYSDIDHNLTGGGGFGSYEPDEETIGQLLNEIPDHSEARKLADTVVEEAKTGTQLVTELNDIIERYSDSEGRESLDERIARAQSVAELREDIDTSQGEAFAEVNKRIDEVKEIIQEADTGEVAEGSIRTTNAVWPAIKLLPGTNPKLAVLSLGAAVMMGAYKSAKDDTVLDQINAKELQRHAQVMAGEADELEEVDGKAIGALLGSTSYLIRSMAPEEYAHWVTQADPEAIIYGAEMGAGMSRRLTRSTKLQGALAGGAIGLLYSYTLEENESVEFRKVLDADLYNQYLSTLPENERE